MLMTSTDSADTGTALAQREQHQQQLDGFSQGEVYIHAARIWKICRSHDRSLFRHIAMDLDEVVDELLQTHQRLSSAQRIYREHLRSLFDGHSHHTISK